MIALAVVAAQYAGTFDANITARADARVNQPATPITIGGRQEEIAVAADASFAGTALLHLRDRFWDFYLAYTPSIVVPDLELQVDRGQGVDQAIDPTILNGGSATIRWHDRYSWFSLNESGAYGLVSTSVPYAGAPTTPIPQQQTGTGATGMTTTGMTGTTTGMTSTASNPATTQTTIITRQTDVQYAASSSGFSVGTKLGRRTTATLSGGYSLSGGLNADTTILPYQSGPTGALSVVTRLSPSESLFTSASGNDTLFKGTCPLEFFSFASAAIAAQAAAENPNGLPCETRTDTFQLEEGYRRQLSKVGLASASVGVAAIRGPVEGGAYSLGIAPVFSLSYTQTLYTYWPGTLTVNVGVAPTVDLLTSIVSDVGTALVMLNARVTKMVTLAFSLNANQSIPIPSNDSPLTGFGATVEAHFRLNQQADFIVGNQEYWQYQVYAVAPGIPAQASTSFTALAYVGVTLRAPKLHF